MKRTWIVGGMHRCVDRDGGLVIIGKTMKKLTTRYTERILFLGNTCSVRSDKNLTHDFLIEHFPSFIASTN